jgi:membrane protein required for colicin V production
MTWVDYAVIGIAALSILWGGWRGVVREIISLAGWVIAFLAANLFAGPASELVPQVLQNPQLRAAAAFIAVFLVTLVVTTLFGVLLSKLVQAVGLGGLDRALGALFGLARAVLVVVALALLAGLTNLPRQPVWKESLSGGALAYCGNALKGWLPPTFAERLSYD